MLRSLSQFLLAISLAFVATFILAIIPAQSPQLSYTREIPQDATSTAPLEATSTATTTPIKVVPIEKAETALESTEANDEEVPANNQVFRIDNPYSFPPKTTDELNTLARSAVVNIFCRSGGLRSSMSGSGVIIDPRGVILTNAHVAQFILISKQSSLDISCTIRTGAPAEARWTADILYFPTAWAEEHAGEITQTHTKGTGEYDYALLLITGTTDGKALPGTFPFMEPDTREAIAFAGDSVLLAGYPAEFGTTGALANLYQTSVFTQVTNLLTFNENTADVLSLGNIVLAQSGSSGGAVINLWGQLVGLISTTSEGSTTADRNLNAISLAYINRDMAHASGSSLRALLRDDVISASATFTRNVVPSLAEKIIPKSSN